MILFKKKKKKTMNGELEREVRKNINKKSKDKE